MNTSMIDYAGAPAGKQAAREIDYHGANLSVPAKFWNREKDEVNLPALLKSHDDLRRKVSIMGKAPVKYEIRVPKDIAARRAVAEDDPMAVAAMEWARRHNLPQQAFDELVETFVRQEDEQLDPDGFRAAQMAALKERLGHRCDEVCKDVGHWFGALMRKDFEADPDLREAAEELASDARGVMLLKAIRDRLTEHGVPGNHRTGSGALDEAGLCRLQASDAYVNARHPDHAATVRRVREGWQTLVGRS